MPQGPAGLDEAKDLHAAQQLVEVVRRTPAMQPQLWCKPHVTSVLRQYLELLLRRLEGGQLEGCCEVRFGTQV